MLTMHARLSISIQFILEPPAVKIEMAVQILSVLVEVNVLMYQLPEWELCVILVLLDSLEME